VRAVPIAQKLSMKEKQCQYKVVCFKEEIAGIEATTPENYPRL
jgi:hypothetical protein